MVERILQYPPDQRILDGLGKSELDADVKARLSAEARFFRADLYFMLMRNHGSVILIKEITNEPLHARSTTEECWDFIEEELDFAAATLPAEWESQDAGRVTKELLTP